MSRTSGRRKNSRAAKQVVVKRFLEGGVRSVVDLVTVEEPLEIRLVAEDAGKRQVYSVAVTMRTPGHDFELAAGFLVSEGVVRSSADIWKIEHCREVRHPTDDNIVEVHLVPGVSFDVDQLIRNVMTTSACGICGRTSIESVQEICMDRPRGEELRLVPEMLSRLTSTLADAQPVFSTTGGLHAAALFDSQGELLLVREDVGRHNALDKIVGALLMADQIPASERIVMVSGRASFELVQKSLLAGIPVLIAVGAPSSLAIDLASEYGMTLMGFFRADRFNLYCGSDRLAAD